MREADEVLYELSLLIHHDNNYHISRKLRCMSWQVLGVCQQMNGDDWAACQSYLTALQLDFLTIKVAVCVRLGTILGKYFS